MTKKHSLLDRHPVGEASTKSNGTSAMIIGVKHVYFSPFLLHTHKQQQPASHVSAGGERMSIEKKNG